MERLGYRSPKKKNAARAAETTAIRAAFVYTLDALRMPGDQAMSSYCCDIISGMQKIIAGSSCSLTVFRGADHVDHDVMVKG